MTLHLLRSGCWGVIALMLFLTSFKSSFSEHLPYKNIVFNETVFGNVSKDNDDLWKYDYTRTKGTIQAVRVECSSESAEEENPLVLVARLQKGVVSWAIPLISEGGVKHFYSSRILCPSLESKVDLNRTQYFHVHVATASPVPVTYQLKASFVPQFEISLEKPSNFEVDPAGPTYKVFYFTGNLKTVRIEATSDSEFCAILSIQNTQCPVYDLARNVEFTGFFQTMTKKAAITIQKEVMDQFYVVIIVKTTDTECETGYRSANPMLPDHLPAVPSLQEVSSTVTPDIIIGRKKIVSIKIVEVGSVDSIIDAIMFPIIVFGSFYSITFLYILGSWCKQRGLPGKSFLSVLMPKKTETNDEDDNADGVTAPIIGARSASLPRNPYGSFTDSEDNVDGVTAPINEGRSASLSRNQYGSFTEGAQNTESNRETELHEYDHTSDSIINGPSGELLGGGYDMLNDLEHEKDIYRLRTVVTLADLAKKNPKYLKKKYKLYHWNLIVIAVFYTLPVLQLVMTYQNVLNVSGDEDICYYNFFCSYPLAFLSSFNNVYSNIGYIMLGFLFFFIVLRRDRLHKQAVASKDLQEKHCGIPKHYELFYAMAIALVMEGVLSACYHICPTKSNFQFDTSFMYIITCLGMIKVYQIRHPDIVTSAHKMYLLFAGIIFIAVIGVLFSSFTFWLVFCIIYIAISLYLSFQVYYMGRVKFDSGLLARIYIFVRYDCCAFPIYKERMLLLLVANTVNWTFAICGVSYQPKDFATYLLAILIVNGLLYVGFYVIMKIRNKERIMMLPMVVSVLTVICWIIALIFFFQELTSWQKSPALSREGNRKCILLGFYDDHDIWHLLSATAIFFSFLTVLTLDDDLEGIPRTRISVF